MSEQLDDIKLPTPLEAAHTLAAVLLELDPTSAETVLRAGLDPESSPNQALIYQMAGMIIRGETVSPGQMLVHQPSPAIIEAVGV